MAQSDFNKVAAILLKLHFGMGVLLYICCIFSENLLLRTPLSGYFQMVSKISEHSQENACHGAYVCNFT